jgi:hypothetical protein
MPDYAVRAFQLNHFFKLYLQDLFNHFKKQKVPFDMIYSKWILTIFSQYLPFELLKLVWNFFIIVKKIIYKKDRWKAIIKVSLLLLSDISHKLLKLDLDEICLFFRGEYKAYHMTPQKLLRLYNSDLYPEIKNKSLKTLRDNYYMEIVKEKLNVILL